MQIEFEDIELDNEYWVYTGEIFSPVDFVTVTETNINEIVYNSKSDGYFVGDLSDFAFFDNEREAVELAAVQLIKSLKKNDKKLESLK